MKSSLLRKGVYSAQCIKARFYTVL